MTTQTRLSSEDLAARDAAHVFRPRRAHDVGAPLFMERGAGSYLWDYDGNRYVDFLSQWVFANIGHQHPRMIEALQQQLGTLANIAPSYGNATRATTAKLVADRAPAGLNHVFFTSSGSEATEHAIKMARLATKRHKVLAAYRSFHGSTANAVALSGDARRWPGDTATQGFVRFLGPYRYRSAFDATSDEEECERALRHLEQVITLEGPETIAAIVLETIGGSAGVLIPPDGYLEGVRQLCDRFGILLVLDEVVVAFGRVGTWFGLEHWGVVPDLMILGKGFSSGYAPLGAVVLGDHVVEALAGGRAYPTVGSFSGHLLATAAGAANIRILEEEGILDHATWLGEQVLGPRLRELADRHRLVGECRGLGAYWTLEVVRDRDTREPLDGADMQLLVAELRRRGVLTGSNDGRLTIAPPCNTSGEDAAGALELVDEALTATAAALGV